MTSLSELEMLFLLSLIARGGEAPQKDIAPTLKASQRDGLVSVGLILKDKRKGNAIWLSVTDKGYDFAARNLDAQLPARTTAGAEILRLWLTKLKTFLEAKDICLADFLTAERELDSEAMPQPTPRNLRERIRAAYLKTTGGELNRRTLLKDVRSHLQDLDRGEVDSALVEMHRKEEILLLSNDNRRAITREDVDAALTLAGEPRHILWIEK
jgi:hypothetical protein